MNRTGLVFLVGFSFFLSVMTFSGVGSRAYAAKATRKSEEKATKQDLLLIAGLQSTLDLDFQPCQMRGSYEECIRIANKGLVTVQYSKDKKQLIFTPVKRGETTVAVRDESGGLQLILRVVVSESNLKRRLRELQVLLRDIEGIRLRIMADKIIVDGEVVVLGDLNRIYTVLSDESYKSIVLNLVTVSPVGMQMLAERIQDEINNPAVKVRVLNNQFVVEGQVQSAGEAKSVLNLVRSMIEGFTVPRYLPEGFSTPIDVKFPKIKDPVIARLTIAPRKPKPEPKMVRVTIDFVELSKDYLRNFGFSWIPSLEAGGSVSFGQSSTGGVTSQGSGSLAGTIGNLFPKLSAAQNAGYARILEESIAIVKMGKVATFQRLFQIPLRSVNQQGQVVFNKVDVGPKFDIKPISSNNDGAINLELDLSYNGFAGNQGDAPLILNHKYKTEVAIRSGRSAAIINAMSNTVTTSFNKDPPGGQVPSNPLFTLLRSKAFQKNKSQFVIFVTPQIIESTSEGTEDIKKKYGLRRKLK